MTRGIRLSGMMMIHVVTEIVDARISVAKSLHLKRKEMLGGFEIPSSKLSSVSSVTCTHLKDGAKMWPKYSTQAL